MLSLFPFMSHVDCTFTFLEMTLFFFFCWTTNSHWVMLPKQISAAQLEFTQSATGPPVPIHLKLVPCSVLNRLHNLRFWFFFLYFAYTACVLRVSTVSVIMQYGLGRGAGVGRRVTWGYPLIYCIGHHLLAPLCSPCKNVLPRWVQTDGQPASIIHCYSFMLSHLCVIAFHYSSEPPSPLPDRFE